MAISTRHTLILELMLAIFCFGVPFGLCNDPSSIPQQIHLSLGGNPTEIVVTWTTYNEKDESWVEFGEQQLKQTTAGTTNLFVDGGPMKRRHYIHRTLLSGLAPFTHYQYRCGSKVAWSQVYHFQTLSNRTDWSPRLIIYGDLGLENGVSIPRITQEVNEGKVDVIFHNGDFAYDMDWNNSYVGDEFMRQIEPIAARVPYQTAVGNHEFAYNFSNYNNRFSMYDMTSPGGATMSNHFYAFHLGPALFISFSTEFYYFVEYGLSQILTQYKWLKTVLKDANKPEARALHPWIITLGHRPMYCTDDDADDCTRQNSIIRKGIPLFHTLGLEDLFHTYGVDVNFWAHEHSYERLFPVFDLKVMNGSLTEPYINPPAPVHIITGSAGCREKLDTFGRKKPWSAFRLSDYGYTRLHLLNGTHLSIEQVSDEQDGKVVDAILLIQEKHAMRPLASGRRV